MWHFLMLAIAYACVLASPAEAAPKKKGPPPDPFKACDLQVRADLREGGTWLIPRDIHLDEGRLMLSVTFLPEKSIRSVPKVLYGNSDEEKRRQLRSYLEQMKAAIDAATKESAWFVIASKKTLPPDLRSSAGYRIGGGQSVGYQGVCTICQLLVKPVPGPFWIANIGFLLAMG